MLFTQLGACVACTIAAFFCNPRRETIRSGLVPLDSSETSNVPKVVRRGCTRCFCVSGRKPCGRGVGEGCAGAKQVALVQETLGIQFVQLVKTVLIDRVTVQKLDV